ncbi:hypothetical protein HDU67_007820 [Dinochytrium kinnereticum]|nr:hypothetical protein HDU67_007820 [Dinochytrium kinnereticum]
MAAPPLGEGRKLFLARLGSGVIALTFLAAVAGLAVLGVAIRNARDHRTYWQRRINISGIGGAGPLEVFTRWKDHYSTLASLRNVLINATYTTITGIKPATTLFNDTNGFSYAYVDTTIPIDSNIRLIPVLATGIVLIYNLPTLNTSHHLTLSRRAIVGIFDGSITAWNHPTLLRDNLANEGVVAALSASRVSVVVRKDDCGETEIMSRALGAFSVEWAGKVGVLAGAVGWPVKDVVVDGAAAVAMEVLRTPYSIGYVDMATAINLPTAAIINKVGETILPTSSSFRYAAEDFTSTADGDSASAYIHLVDATGDLSYPISMFMYLAIRVEYPSSCIDAYELVRYLLWVTTDEAGARTLHESDGFSVLGESSKQIAKSVLRQIRCSGSRESLVDRVFDDMRVESLSDRDVDIYIAVGIMLGALMAAAFAVLMAWRSGLVKVSQVSNTQDRRQVRGTKKQRDTSPSKISTFSPSWRGMGLARNVIVYITKLGVEICVIVLELFAFRSLRHTQVLGKAFLAFIIIGAFSLSVEIACRTLIFLFQHSNATFEEKVLRVQALATRRLPFDPAVAITVEAMERVVAKRHYNFLVIHGLVMGFTPYSKRIPME